MKKLILAITVAAFTVGVYAGDSANKDKAASADKEKAATCCATSKSQCPSGATAKQGNGKKIAQSPKGEQANKS